MLNPKIVDVIEDIKKINTNISINILLNALLQEIKKEIDEQKRPSNIIHKFDIWNYTYGRFENDLSSPNMSVLKALYKSVGEDIEVIREYDENGNIIFSVRSEYLSKICVKKPPEDEEIIPPPPTVEQSPSDTPEKEEVVEEIVEEVKEPECKCEVTCEQGGQKPPKKTVKKTDKKKSKSRIKKSK